MQERRRGLRARKRLGCEMRVGTRRYFGMALNVSDQGLFLQTNAKIERGTALELTLGAAHEATRFELRGRVARLVRAPQQLASIVPSGLGIRLTDPPTTYRAFVASLFGSAPGATVQPAGDFRFQVEMREVEGAETRTLLVSCNSEAEATELANAELSEGWKVVSVRPVSA